MILAIDPGPTHSAFVDWNGSEISAMGIPENQVLVDNINQFTDGIRGNLVIEQVASYGMPVGAEVFETVFWSGRFAQAFRGQFHRLPRIKIKQHLCHDSRAKDGNIRQALIDRFGPPGTKRSPGLLYGVKKDIWAALALAVTWWDLNTGSGG